MNLLRARQKYFTDSFFTSAATTRRKLNGPNTSQCAPCLRMSMMSSRWSV